jgi:hypothetical protein
MDSLALPCAEFQRGEPQTEIGFMRMIEQRLEFLWFGRAEIRSYVINRTAGEFAYCRMSANISSGVSVGAFTLHWIIRPGDEEGKQPDHHGKGVCKRWGE